MDVIEPVNVKASDIKRLESAGDIRIDGNKVHWTGDAHDDGRYIDVQLLAQAGNIFIIAANSCLGVASGSILGIE